MSDPAEARKPAGGYTGGVAKTSEPGSTGPSLREEQVAQTRAALVAAGRRLFGRDGYAATSVEDLAREARVTTGALYHHFPAKTALFETVFEHVHAELLAASAAAAAGAPDEIEALARGFETFLDSMLAPEVQRIIVTDAPAVLGLTRFTELDERYAFGSIVAALGAASAAGRLRAQDPETLARLLLGALTRGSMLIASSHRPQLTRDRIVKALRALLTGLVQPPVSP
jgi:AcrR family transcriptional regulator